MPARHKRTKVAGERNLYAAGDVYWACATPPGGRQAEWLKLGPVGIMEARRRRDDFVARVRRGELGTVTRRARVREIAELYLAECEQLVGIGAMAPSTLDSYRLGLRGHFLPGYGNRAITSLRAEDLVRWHREQQRAGAAAWTIRARWTAVRGMLVYATRHRLIPTNPADLLTRRERPSPGESRVRFLHEQEMRALLAATPERFRAAVATMLFTGLRASEALGLVWGDIDFTKRQVLVRHQMGRRGERTRLKSKGAAREVILIPRLAVILEEHRRTSRWSTPDDLVFTSTVGTSMTYRRLSQAVQKATTNAGLRGVSAHVLRHTFASILIYQGRDVAFVSRQLGHTTPSTTWDSYVHLFNEAKQAGEARDQLDAEFGPVLDGEAVIRRPRARPDDGKPVPVAGAAARARRPERPRRRRVAGCQRADALALADRQRRAGRQALRPAQHP
jgi:integrase